MYIKITKINPAEDNDPKNINNYQNKINKPYKKPQSTFPS